MEWLSFRALLTRKVENQQRITVTLQREDGKTIHLRNATKAEPQQSDLYKMLGISEQPGGIKKTLISFIIGFYRQYKFVVPTSGRQNRN